MLEGLIIYCLCIFFVHYLINEASLFDKVRAYIYPKLPLWLQKSLNCGFCFAFWVSAILSLLFGFDIYTIMSAPVVVMYLSLTYQKLNPQPPILK